jgi:hypothetical protein
MIRPLLLLLFGAALLGSSGCAGSDVPPPRTAPPIAAAPPSGRPAPRVAGAGPAIDAPQPPQVARDRAAVAEACRRDADRVVLYRDRGQLMREDERDARVGTDSSIYARRVETDRLGRVFERDRLAAECVQQQDTGPAAARRR